MERDINEIIKSMSEMAGIEYDNRVTQTLSKLNEYIKDLITKKNNTNSILINYNELIVEPDSDLNTLAKFLNIEIDNLYVKSVIDKKLYRIKH
jgi:hypothetical protein